LLTYEAKRSGWSGAQLSLFCRERKFCARRAGAKEPRPASEARPWGWRRGSRAAAQHGIDALQGGAELEAVTFGQVMTAGETIWWRSVHNQLHGWISGDYLRLE
jgi:hypothetical protein